MRWRIAVCLCSLVFLPGLFHFLLEVMKKEREKKKDDSRAGIRFFMFNAFCIDLMLIIGLCTTHTQLFVIDQLLMGDLSVNLLICYFSV